MLKAKGGAELLSEKLYKLRKKSGLSQEQLAEQLNVSRQAISKWESGAAVPESEKLIIISEYFKVSVDYLLKDVDEEEQKGQENKVTLWIWNRIICREESCV